MKLIDVEGKWFRANDVVSITAATDYGTIWWVNVRVFQDTTYSFGCWKTKEEAKAQAAAFAARVNDANNSLYVF
jgi:hypothetical protein